MLEPRPQTPPEFAAALPEIAAFVRARVPEAREWEGDRLERWLEWFHRRQLLGVIRDASGAVVAVGTARPIADSERPEAYRIEWQGETIWIDIAAADTRAHTRALWWLLLARIGPRRWVRFDRAKHGRRGIRYEFTAFIAKFLETQKPASP